MTSGLETIMESVEPVEEPAEYISVMVRQKSEPLVSVTELILQHYLVLGEPSAMLGIAEPAKYAESSQVTHYNAALEAKPRTG